MSSVNSTFTSWRERLAVFAVAGLFFCLFLALSAATADAASLEQKLVAPDGAAKDYYGGSVAIDGDTAVVGASGVNSDSGAIYVYTRTAETWNQTQKLTTASGDALGKVAIDGNTIVAGASSADGVNANQGAAYVFSRGSDGTWAQSAKLTASDGANNDAFGGAVAIDGDEIVVGAWMDDGAKTDQGSAYTFVRNDKGIWAQTAKLTANAPGNGDFLGLSVAIDGDMILVGAFSDDMGANADQGSAYTFTRTGADRTEAAKLSASDGAKSDSFGYSVALGPNLIAVGAPQIDGANINQGGVYTYDRATLAQQARLTASDGQTGDALGGSLAFDANTLIAGALDADATVADQGAAYVFRRGAGAFWAQGEKLVTQDDAGNDNFGASVALDGDEAIVGANADTVGANQSQGSASIFYKPTPPPDQDQDQTPDATDNCPTQPGPPENAGCPASIGPPGGPGPDKTPPNTTITKAPRKKTAKTKTKIAFVSTEPNSTFTCKLDKRPAKACSSPYRPKRLKAGKHRFSVYASDAAGNVDQTPAVVRWKVRR